MLSERGPETEWEGDLDEDASLYPTKDVTWCIFDIVGSEDRDENLAQKLRHENFVRKIVDDAESFSEGLYYFEDDAFLANQILPRVVRSSCFVQGVGFNWVFWWVGQCSSGHSCYGAIQCCRLLQRVL